MGIVWVLGAGFSKSLGGPLLPQLLSKHSWPRLRARYAGTSERLMERLGTRSIRRLLDLVGWEADGPSRKAFSDAEELLETLDAAARPDGDAVRRRLSALGEREVDEATGKEMLAAARHLVAAECACFLRDHPINGERWEPYRKWVQSLEADDVIISFNYDLVVEEAAKAVRKQLDVALNDSPVRIVAPQLIKLHGSVDWSLQPSGELTATEDPDFAVACDDALLAIASPGPSKLEMAGNWRGLWRMAEMAIRKAGTLVFIGYRFPQSDANARNTLLNAVSGVERLDVAVHTVLGPNTASDDTVRLEALLSHALRRSQRDRLVRTGPRPSEQRDKVFSLDVQPLFAEDFLGVVGRWDVENPYRFKTR